MTQDKTPEADARLRAAADARLDPETYEELRRIDPAVWGGDDCDGALQLAASLVAFATAARPPLGLAATTRRNMLQQLLQQEADSAALTGRRRTGSERPAPTPEEAEQIVQRHDIGERDILQKMSLMAALPVRSPNGGKFILGYQCPQCWRVYMAKSAWELSRWRNIPRVDELDRAQQTALTCCRCKRCNAWLQTREERYREPVGAISYHDDPCCNACLPAVLAAEQERETERERVRARYQARLDASLIDSYDPDAARDLCAFMSVLSEKYYCAGWLIGLEYQLWSMVHGGSRECGPYTVTPEEVTKLRRLHERAGGWWMWAEDSQEPGASGQVFVPTAEWRKVVAQRVVP